MSPAALISVEEYLTTLYRPDYDFVDGELIERNLGTKDHSKLQGQILLWFVLRGEKLGLAAFPEQRVQVGPRRYRIPDVCVVKLPEPDEQIFTQPPYICIEVLSPDDAFPKLQARFDDYLAMSVPNIWVLDPVSRRAWIVSRQGHLEVLDGTFRSADGNVALNISELN